MTQIKSLLIASLCIMMTGCNAIVGGLYNIAGTPHMIAGSLQHVTLTGDIVDEDGKPINNVPF